ncbi:hypothetical protein THRCLA_20683 [Thraustotheca clavata]|uniref:Uncharacterized protein n=1 Tax=Thraustotheca clavata TaxID=74557 RepID=A0A1W0A4R2_9STRA|nr:hypothetical protein THRCLA_20683 [Thraustotheca clavata]
MVTVCARCQHRISVFTKKRKCSSCYRRVCKECHTKDSTSRSTLPRSFTSPHLSPSSEAQLVRHGSMPTLILCPFGCKDDSIEGPMQPETIAEASPTSSEEPRERFSSSFDQEPPENDLELKHDYVPEQINPNKAIAVDTVRGFVVGVLVCMLWALIAGNVVHKEYSTTGVGAMSIFGVIVYYSQSKAAIVFNAFKHKRD